MASTTYLRTLILNKWLRNINYQIDNLYLALFTDSITDDNYLNVEVLQPGYERMPVTFDATWKNTNEIFWLADTYWGDIKFVGLCTSSTGAYLTAYQGITTINMQPYTGIKILAGGLTVTIT